MENIIPENLINAFGWTIIHSFWQGALVALLLSIVLLALNRRSSGVRYIAAVGALLIFASITVRTFIDQYENAGSNNIKVEQIQQANEPAHINNQAQLPIADATNISLIGQLDTWIKDHFREQLPLLTAIYFIGLLFLILKLTGGFLYTQRIKHYRVNYSPDEYQKIVAKISSLLNVKRKVRFLESALVKVPVTIGYLKPVILFPIGTLTGMSYNQVEAVLAHELAHIKRADYLVNFLQSIIEVIFFYHPAVWWISSIIRDERENICDDIAVDVCRKPAELAKALLFVGGLNSGEPAFVMSAVGNGNQLKNRIKRILGENKMKNIRDKVYAASFMLLIVISFGFYSCGSSDSSVYYKPDGNLIYKEKYNGDRVYINTDRLDEEQKRYIFYKRVNGERVKWEVTIDDNRIVELYKDNNEVPDSEYYLYEDMIYDEIDDIDDDLYELTEDLGGLDEELVQLKDDLEDIKIEFDSDEFKRNMKELKRELKDIKKHDFSFHFDSDEFDREMKNLKEELKDIHVDIDFDSDEFSREMANLSRELASIKVDIPDIDIDMSGLAEGMKNLKHELGNIDIDMSELKKEMRKFKSFMREAKREMVEDGLIDKYGDIDNLEFENDTMYLNYERIPDHLVDKYREIYKKHFGHYPDEDSFGFHN